MATEYGKRELFTGLPRTRRFGGAVTIGLALVICGAFVTDAVPTRSPEDWLYASIARQDQLARAHEARLQPAAQSKQVIARTPTAPKTRRVSYAAVSAPVVDETKPLTAVRSHERCLRAF
jgi:hypothetical protein